MVYCKVFKGNVPINDALVELTVSLANQTILHDPDSSYSNAKRFRLTDNGSEPDVTKNDGIYTKYLHFAEKGVHRLDIVASSNGEIAYIQSAGKQKQHDPQTDKFSVFIAYSTSSFFFEKHRDPIISKRIPST